MLRFLILAVALLAPLALAIPDAGTLVSLTGQDSTVPDPDGTPLVAPLIPDPQPARGIDIDLDG